ncbi:MAG: c-type cytochrome [Pseudomonadota bacterium]
MNKIFIPVKKYFIANHRSTMCALFASMAAVLPAPSATMAAEPGPATEKLYAEYCSVCHGDKGDGKSHAVQGLNPPPRDFTAPGASLQLSREYMIAIIKDGKPGTAMTPWKSQLNDSQVESLVDYIQSHFMQLPGSSTAVDNGKTIYASTCSVCHGDDGAGAVWGRTSLNPPPVNFTRTDPDNDMTRERMLASVTHGRPGTAMTAFASQLTATEIATVVDYIRNTFMQGQEDAATDAVPGSPAPAATTVGMAVLHSMPEQRHAPVHKTDTANPGISTPPGLTGNADTGKAYYLMNCTACHGSNGDGNGPRAYFIFPRPRNFLLTENRTRLQRPVLFNAIKQGVTGREMPAWGKVMTDQQIADVTEYVYQAFIEDNTPDNEP